jgi:sterol desaturase/sphingolipid hydroxylase (fatty acid hydroxylase superfamily)
MERLIVLAIALGALGIGFGVLEKFWPSVRGQRRWRKGILTDLTYYAFVSTIGRVFSGVLVFIAVLIAANAAGMDLNGRELRNLTERNNWVSRQPLVLQALELIVLGDFLGYWSHRAFHTFSRLWRIHAVHHSSTEVDWLSSVRVHPLNDALQNVVVATPLFLIGFTPGVLAAYVPLLTLYAIALHANVSWTYGPLRYVVTSPTFHRWHHSSQPEAINKNFAGLLPLWDLIFGTLYLPKGLRPEAFGVSDPVPSGFLGQLVYPLRLGAPTSA